MSNHSVRHPTQGQLSDQDRASTDAKTPCKENLEQAAKMCSQDSESLQRPALQENAFQPLLTPGGPLALSPPRTLRSSQKWGSLSASRILGLSPNGSRLRGKSLVLSPMCSRAAPASQGHPPQTGVRHFAASTITELSYLFCTAKWATCRSTSWYTQP